MQTLKQILKDRGLRQKAVAERLGVTTPVFCRWANRQIDIPSKYVARLAEEIGVSTDDVLAVAVSEQTP
jgi:transcriptional regulator with XRE-family HTH domain